MKNNNQTNWLIKWMVIVGDFVLLAVLILCMANWDHSMRLWPMGKLNVYLLVNFIALMVSESRFSTIVHLRVAGAGEIVRRIVGLTALHAVVAYLLLKVMDYRLAVGWLLLIQDTLMTIALLAARLGERWFIKLYREAGRNTRTVTLVGSDSELLEVYHKLKNDATLGYRILGYYGDEGTLTEELKWLGTLEELLAKADHPEQLALGNEMYVCISRKSGDIVRRLSVLCDQNVIRFFYVPVSLESLHINLKREMLDDLEIFTTHENPLQNSVNKAVKRAFDIVLSSILLIITGILFPFIYLKIKSQSPGPILFRQERTGQNGKVFKMLKFRSMHVNKDADKVQATKDDPRKFPFGDFMRRTNIDELPQFWNVLKGEMSIVGPRPHMLAHTEIYSHLINKYMVRHFVKPGVTGWAQVTGYRGGTEELWQMEGRVKRDIWYMEHWTIWLDIRIIWLTAKTVFIHDKNAY